MLLVSLALSWAPITAHCGLERLEALAFLTCCTHDDAAPHEDDDCQSDGCAVVEAGLYKVENNALQLVCPSLSGPDFLHPEFLRGLPRSLPGIRGARAAPVLIAASWQFRCRAAMPIRAPSLAS